MIVCITIETIYKHHKHKYLLVSYMIILIITGARFLCGYEV